MTLGARRVQTTLLSSSIVLGGVTILMLASVACSSRAHSPVTGDHASPTASSSAETNTRPRSATAVLATPSPIATAIRTPPSVVSVGPTTAEIVKQVGITVQDIVSYRRSDNFKIVLSFEDPAVLNGRGCDPFDSFARFIPVGYWRSLLFPSIPTATPGFNDYRIALVRLDEVSRIIDFVNAGEGGRLRCSNLALQLQSGIGGLEGSLRAFSVANGTPPPQPLDRQSVVTWCVQTLPVMLGGPGFGCRGDPATLTIKTVLGQLASLPATRSTVGTYPTPSLNGGPSPLDLAIANFCNNQILGGGYGAHIEYTGPTDNDYSCMAGPGQFSVTPIALAPSPTPCPIVTVGTSNSFSVKTVC